MTEKTIRRLKIENFKSIDSLESRRGLLPFRYSLGRMARARATSLMRWTLSVVFVRGGVESRAATGAWGL